MDPLEIARWQFGITTVYHFLMVPLTLGLGAVVVYLQTRWNRTGDERYLRMTKFWGKLYLINFIMGVATGIVQEFQFGMAWSEYSRFVGDVFGAPLALGVSTGTFSGKFDAVRLVQARLSKRTRALPVATLYEQGRVHHAGAFTALEDEMCRFGAEGMAGSPDRVDALVWAVWALMLDVRAVGVRQL